MPSVDERTWLSDELWAQVRPQTPRFRVTISAAVVAAAVGAVVLLQIGFFHPRVGASYDDATVQGNRLTVVLTLYDSAQVPVRVTGFRVAQPGVRIVSTRFNGAFSPASANPGPDGARAAPFTVHTDHLESVTIVYQLDCSKLRAPLRLNIGTRTWLGNQTTTATLDSATSGPLKQVCAGA